MTTNRAISALIAGMQFVMQGKNTMKSSTFLWKDMTFWKSSTWQQVKDILVQTEKNKLLAPELGCVFRPFASIKPQKIKVAMFFPETYCKRDVACGLPLFYKTATKKDKFDPTNTTYMFGEFAEKLMDEGYSVKRVNPRNWFRQGVFLWNVFPTTIDKDTRQHEGLGWGRLMGELIETLYLVDPNTLFVFFGHKLDPFIDLVPVDSTTLFFELPDPIDNLLFHDQEIFGRINRFLKAQNRDAINWSLI